MPNYCNNRLQVSGDAKELKKFLKIGLKTEPMRYKENETEVVWRMSAYYPTPKPLTRTISPARDAKWVNEYEVNHAQKMIDTQSERIAKIKADLQTAPKNEIDSLLYILEEAQKPITIPDLVACANGTEKDRKALIKKYGTDNWYDWNVKNWGTKWDCTSDNYSIDTNEFVAYFESAWSPPIAWLEYVVAKFPKLNFKLTYSETGVWFAGVAYSENGEVCEETGEPMWLNDNGDEVEWDSDRDSYVDSNGNLFDDATEINPFDDFEASWERSIVDETLEWRNQLITMANSMTFEELSYITETISRELFADINDAIEDKETERVKELNAINIKVHGFADFRVNEYLKSKKKK